MEKNTGQHEGVLAYQSYVKAPKATTILLPSSEMKFHNQSRAVLFIKRNLVT
jgi:hypothetical protein